MKNIIMIASLFLCMATNIYAQESEPSVREGGYGDAIGYASKHNLLVLFIYGGKGKKDEPEKYSAKEYAELLQEGFKNPKYTNFPTETVVFYQESGEYGPTVARVLINGKDYKTENGASTFSPSLIGNHIDIFTKYYREKNGIPLNKKKLVGNSN